MDPPAVQDDQAHERTVAVAHAGEGITRPGRLAFARPAPMEQQGHDERSDGARERHPHREDPLVGNEKHDVAVAEARGKAGEESQERVIEKVPDPEDPKEARRPFAPRRAAEERDRRDHDERCRLARLLEQEPVGRNRVERRPPPFGGVEARQRHHTGGFHEGHGGRVEGDPPPVEPRPAHPSAGSAIPSSAKTAGRSGARSRAESAAATRAPRSESTTSRPRGSVVERAFRPSNARSPPAFARNDATSRWRGESGTEAWLSAAPRVNRDAIPATL